MIIKKLTIHNIASIEDAEINFEAQPLSDSEVFLITGKTGSGKSTILDAICLALYADTPRLDNTKMQGETAETGRDKTIQVDDPRQLMRRNTGEAYVKLTFRGSNGINYEATWNVSRAHKKVTGALQRKSWELKNLDDKKTLSKDKEIQDEIKVAVGLDFSQFCRTTLLAQGEFTRFLNSKDDEKADILEKITGVDIYSKIGAKIYEQTGKMRQEYNEAQQRIEGTPTLSREDVAEKNKELEELDTKHKELKAANEQEGAKCEWLKQEAKLSGEKDVAESDLQKAQERVASDDYKHQETLVKEWNATIEARLRLNESKNAEDEKSKLSSTLKEYLAEFAKVIGGHKYAEEEADNIAQGIKDIDQWLEQEQPRVHVYENAQTIIGHLKSIDTDRKDIEKNEVEIKKITKSLNDNLIPASEKATQAAEEAKGTLNREEEALKKEEEKLAALNLSGLRQEHDSAKDLLNNIKTAEDRINTLTELREKREKTEQQLTDRNKAISDKQKQVAEMEKPLQEAEEKMNASKEKLDSQKDTIDKFASAMRAKLQQGDICPVCRQKLEAALPKEDELAAMVDGLQRDFDTAEKEYNDLRDNRRKLEAEISTETSAYERDLKAYDEDTSVAKAEKNAMEACQACDITLEEDTIKATLENLKATTDRRREGLSTEIKKGETQEKAIKEQHQALEDKRKKLEKLIEEREKADKAVSESQNQVATLQQLIESKRGSIATSEQSVRELMVGDWAVNWNESPLEFANILDSATKKYNEKNQRKQSLTQNRENSAITNRNVATVIEAIYSTMPSWREIAIESVGKIDNLLDKANQLNRSVTQTKTQLETAEATLNKCQQELDKFFDSHSDMTPERLAELNKYPKDQIDSLDKGVKKGAEEVVAKQTLLTQSTERLAEHRNKKPEIGEDETLEFLEEKLKVYTQAMEELIKRQGAITQELQSDADNKQKRETLIKEADEKKEAYQKWDQLNQLIGSSDGRNFRKIAQSYVLESLIHSANSYMKKLTDRYTLKVTPGTFVISLEDAYQGYVSRAASTISGGESFLVSLSLALALSDIGDKWQVNTLFIDEGFGTLSGGPLEKAIDTLRSLHTTTGRHVGIISHVEELRERIPVQIQVNQEGNNSSSQIKIIPE
ncbi:MAG: AAA family ATPase [Lepagella sp.]